MRVLRKLPRKLDFEARVKKKCTMMAAMILSVTLIAVIKVIKVGFLVAGPNEFKESDLKRLKAGDIFR